MSYFFELLVDVALGRGENSRSRRTPKPVRYLILCIMSLIFLAAFGFILVCGILFIKTSVVAGIILILLALFLAALILWKAYYTIYPETGAGGTGTSGGQTDADPEEKTEELPEKEPEEIPEKGSETPGGPQNT